MPLAYDSEMARISGSSILKIQARGVKESDSILNYAY
jgi:hypothetical protein